MPAPTIPVASPSSPLEPPWRGLLLVRGATTCPGAASAVLACALVVPVAAQQPCLNPDYQHGISYVLPLKYAPGFEHFDYANPDAPKGGPLRLPDMGTFDSFNNILEKGRIAAGVDFGGSRKPRLRDAPGDRRGRAGQRLRPPGRRGPCRRGLPLGRLQAPGQCPLARRRAHHDRGHRLLIRSVQGAWVHRPQDGPDRP